MSNLKHIFTLIWGIHGPTTHEGWLLSVSPIKNLLSLRKKHPSWPQWICQNTVWSFLIFTLHIHILSKTDTVLPLAVASTISSQFQHDSSVCIHLQSFAAFFFCFFLHGIFSIKIPSPWNEQLGPLKMDEVSWFRWFTVSVALVALISDPVQLERARNKKQGAWGIFAKSLYWGGWKVMITKTFFFGTSSNSLYRKI